MIIELESNLIQWAAEVSRRGLPSTRSLKAHYPNTLRSHIVGKLGELAVEMWATPKFQVDSVFRDPARIAECDLIIDGLRIDVKTWSESSWVELGRCVRPTQLASHIRKTDLFLWTHLVENIDPEKLPCSIQVHLAGTSTIDDVLNAPGWVLRSLPNRQVGVDEMRPLSFLNSQVRGASPTPPHHQVRHSH